MTKGRLEAFSDGVMAVIITIMVLELAAPHEPTWEALRHLTPVVLSYVLSYVFIGIYWSNHHHLMQIVQHVDGRVLWANLHLLFWLSLVPFATAWMGETHFSSPPVAVYGIVLLMASIAYFILTRQLLALHPHDSKLAVALGDDFKGKISILWYIIAVACSSRWPGVACGFYVLVAIMWLVPDRRIERTLNH
ncbi:MAG: TMEM175 family protein [Acidobacteriota bacterium]